MSEPSNIPSELFSLLGELADEQLSDAGQEKLLEILRDSADARTCYLEYMELHARLQWKHNSEDREDTLDRPVVSSSASVQPNLAGAWALSYMVATVVLAAMLLGAWGYKISHVGYPSDGVVNNPRRETHRSPAFVGQITGMKDCRWGEGEPGTIVGASVPLGREYSLTSGLMQITYANGVKVILEGPCTFTADSPAGGYLGWGKLTARVEKRGGRRDGVAASAASAKPQAANPPSPVPSPQPPAPLFSVTTPTAVITDLGTEFGVEVDADGNTTSCVFRGSVKVEAGTEKSVVLRADESVRVEKVSSVRETHHESTLDEKVRFTQPTTQPKFVRRLAEPPKQLDLLDIVAGGNGLGNRRERGIDPSSGRQDTWFVKTRRDSDHQYHRVEWSTLIDGVFIPHVSQWTVPKLPVLRLDSVGSTFDRFQESRVYEGKKNQCSVLGYTTGDIWARSAGINSASTTNRDGWIYSLVNDKQYMPEGRGLLGLYANMGITFDLAAMREMHDGARPARLRAKLGMGDGPKKYPQAFGVADLWIFVDGQLAWVRKDIRHEDGAIDMEVPLDAESRFLTVVSTNGSRGQAYDWIVLGDPVLEMKPINLDGKKKEGKDAKGGP